MIYDIQDIRSKINVNFSSEQEISPTLIYRTVGLETEERLLLIKKALDMGWSADTTQKIKTAVKNMDASIQSLILSEEQRLPQAVIVKLCEAADTEAQTQLRGLCIGVWNLMLD